jgi:hypothetical protein
VAGTNRVRARKHAGQERETPARGPGTWSSRIRPLAGTLPGHSSPSCCGSHRRDTVVVHSVDWLVRNLDDLRALQGLARKGARVEFVKEHLLLTGDDSLMATSCSPSWEPSQSSRDPLSGNAKGTARIGKAAPQGAGNRPSHRKGAAELSKVASPRSTALAGRRCTSTCTRQSQPRALPVQSAPASSFGGFLGQVPIPRCAPPATSRDTPVM